MKVKGTDTQTAFRVISCLWRLGKGPHSTRRKLAFRGMMELVKVLTPWARTLGLTLALSQCLPGAKVVGAFYYHGRPPPEALLLTGWGDCGAQWLEVLQGLQGAAHGWNVFTAVLSSYTQGHHRSAQKFKEHTLLKKKEKNLAKQRQIFFHIWKY